MGTVAKSNEIELNSVRYPIIGQVNPILTSQFAEKMVVGDYNKDSHRDTSSWTISDQRGGILVEEMIEHIHADRAYWSNCQIGFKGHIVLPPLVTEATKPTVTTLSIVNADMELTTGWTNGARSTDQKHGGSNSWKVGTGVTVYQDIESGTNYKKSIYKISVWGYIASGGTGNTFLRIWDGTDTTDSSALTKDGAWHQLTATHTVNPGATRLRIQLQNLDDTNDAYYDDATIDIQPTIGTISALANFNSKLYASCGNILMKLNSGGTGFDYVYSFIADIVALIPSVGNILYIYLGDSDEYWYMSTAEAFTETNVADATKGVHWDSKLFKMDSLGEIKYATTPNNATPSWTSKGTLADEGLADNDVQELFVYRDTTGNPIIYAATKKGLFALDYTNGKWIETELALPDHSNAGKGAIVWRDGCFISAGLDVIKYVAAETALIIPMGLDRNDGLPDKYNAEIIKLIKGYNDLFALVDASQVTGTGYSGVYAWDGVGWQCKWIATGADKVMNTGIVSSAFAYRLWFDHDDKIYYLPLFRGLRNPLKLTTATYGLSGVHITPWFDDDWQVGNKLALTFKVNVGKNVSADEDVVVKYRLDHTYTDIDTGWTTLSTIESSGETEYTFGSSAGTLFKAIQFRFDLARKAVDTTETPDILYAVLSYRKVIPPTWGWQFTVDCSKPYKGRSSEDLLDAVITAAELETLATFVYKDTTYYVHVESVRGERLSGEGNKGTYTVLVKKL